jgi:hypothetical protein
VLHKLSKLALNGVRPANRGCDAFLFVALQLPLLDKSLTTRTRISRFGIVLLHMFITIVCPTKGLIAMRASNDTIVHSLLVVFQQAL